jgi:hypothetical protein
MNDFNLESRKDEQKYQSLYPNVQCRVVKELVCSKEVPRDCQLQVHIYESYYKQGAMYCNACWEVLLETVQVLQRYAKTGCSVHVQTPQCSELIFTSSVSNLVWGEIVWSAVAQVTVKRQTNIVYNCPVRLHASSEWFFKPHFGSWFCFMF